jgi:hypothetical protein
MSLARIFISDSIDPAPQYERFRFDGIRFYRCTFPAGSHQTYRYPEDVPYAKLPSCHIQVSGRMVEPTGVWPDQGPGWISREEDFIIPAGVFTRMAADDVVRWCCTGITNGDRTDFVTPIRLAPGETVALVPGDNLLLAEGCVQVDGQVIEAPNRMKVMTGPRTVEPLTAGYGFRWRTEDVLAQYPSIA